jgi:hypothetical protein
MEPTDDQIMGVIREVLKPLNDVVQAVDQIQDHLGDDPTVLGQEDTVLLGLTQELKSVAEVGILVLQIWQPAVLEEFFSVWKSLANSAALDQLRQWSEDHRVGQLLDFIQHMTRAVKAAERLVKRMEERGIQRDREAMSDQPFDHWVGTGELTGDGFILTVGRAGSRRYEIAVFGAGDFILDQEDREDLLEDILPEALEYVGWECWERGDDLIRVAFILREGLGELRHELPSGWSLADSILHSTVGTPDPPDAPDGGAPDG